MILVIPAKLPIGEAMDAASKAVEQAPPYERITIADQDVAIHAIRTAARVGREITIRFAPIREE